MNRYLRFNLVGILGMGIQLGTLAILHSIIPAHYLLDTTLAIELTLLHNFVWHTCVTWPGTTTPERRLEQLLRFHLANGMVSLTGNLFLMRFLVQGAHMQVVSANLLSISVCSLLNFFLSRSWAFRSARQGTRQSIIQC